MTLKTSYFNLFLDIWIADILQSGAAGVKANFPLLPTVIKNCNTCKRQSRDSTT